MTRKEEADKPINSSMAKDLDEIEKLGKEMETMPTNQQVKKRGQTPDPKQKKNK